MDRINQPTVTKKTTTALTIPLYQLMMIRQDGDRGSIETIPLKPKLLWNRANSAGDQTKKEMAKDQEKQGNINKNVCFFSCEPAYL